MPNSEEEEEEGVFGTDGTAGIGGRWGWGVTVVKMFEGRAGRGVGAVPDELGIVHGERDV
jgi:hypothetical protein